jgi:DedD protein
MEGKQDTEITLGTGKLLGIFFVLTAICAVFFTMGYLLGRSSTPVAASTTMVSTVPSSAGNAVNKPSANGTQATESAGCAPGSANCVAASYAPDAKAQTSADANSSASVSPASAEVVPPSKTASSGSYMVQVAAVSKQEDADILVGALRKKHYPVFVVANSPADALYHVQVGPFADIKEAEAMRSRLAADGYDAMVKK